MRFSFRRRRGSLVAATWISEQLLLLLFDEVLASDDPKVIAHLDGSDIELNARSTSYTCADRGDVEHRRAALMVRFPAPMAAAAFSLEVSMNGRVMRISEGQLTQAITDLRSLLRQQLILLDAVARQRLLAVMFDGAHAELADSVSYSLARNLNLVRDALRPHLATRVRTMHERQAVHVERMLGIDERSFWVRGWASGGGAETQVVLVSPEGQRISLLEDAYRHARPDVDQFFAGARAFVPGIESGAKHGFVGYFEIPSPSLIPSGWIAELRDIGGDGVEVEAPPVETDVPSVRHGIMTDIKDFGSLDLDDELLCRHARPALTKLQERLQESTHIETVTQYGKPIDSPTVSIIVPLYGRIDFMEHQLCQFMHDPDIRQLDLLYVLDSPELGDQLAQSAAALHALYELPFRTVVMSRNAGYSIANNIGASLARGRLLLLLNSDVIPDAPGWVRTLTAFYDATPAIGALGPKLLYEDGSLQHAGLYFDREPGAPLWTNLHYFKGLQSDFQPANIARPVPAVTGACLMIARSLWEEVDGLRSAFVQGGYEDSDLCLRLLKAGRDNWYLPHVELHHLEDQSFPSGARLMATAYNTWLQTHLWGKEIEDLMRDEKYAGQSLDATY